MALNTVEELQLIVVPGLPDIAVGAAESEPTVTALDAALKQLVMFCALAVIKSPATKPLKPETVQLLLVIVVVVPIAVPFW